MDKTKLKKVVVCECAGEVGCCCELLGGEVGLEEGCQVRDLENVEDDPADVR
jgi:hypothetical protein